MSSKQQTDFKCLRCGNEYKDLYEPGGEPVERSCPKCGSNSVRRLPKEK